MSLHLVQRPPSNTPKRRLAFDRLEPRQLLSATAHIDAAWLSSRGAGPYLLPDSDTTYVLDTDITTAGTALLIGGKNVVVNLNGHKVTYDNSAPLTLANGGFESGSGRAVPGWNLAAAPHAGLVPASSSTLQYMPTAGAQSLQLSSITTAESIVSDAIAIPSAGREYTATITPRQSYGVGTKLSVIDTVTGAVLGTATSTDERAFSVVVSFTPTTTHAVKLQVDVTPREGKADTIFLDNATLTISRDYGIVAAPSWYLPSQLSTLLPNGLRASNVTVINGSIIQGQAAGYQSHCLDLKSVAQFTVDNVHTYANGLDTDAVYAMYASNGVISNSTFDNNIPYITNRMHEGAVVAVDGANNILVQGNQFNNVPRAGVYGSSASSITVRNNTMQMNAMASDCYGVGFYGVNTFEISGNTILAPTGKSGRGILIDSAGTNGQVFGNYVDVREKPNAEYGSTGIEATALRFRDYADAGMRNISVHDNTFIARTGVGYAHAALGARVSYRVATNSVGNLNDVFTNNVFEGIVETSDSSYFARGLTLEAVDNATTGYKFVTNTIVSNDTSLGFGGNDGENAKGLTFISNTFSKSSEGAVRAYRSIAAGYSNGVVQGIALFDNRYTNGATSQIVWIGSGQKDISVGYLLGVSAQDASGKALAGASVKVVDKSGTTLFQGTTDAAGGVSGITVVTTVYRQTTTSPTAISTDLRTPFTLTVSKTGYPTSTRQLTPTESSTLPVNLPGGTTANQAPAATADGYSTKEDTALSVAAAGVLGNDTDLDGNSLSAVLVSGPAHGTLALNANGSFSYTPAGNYAGADSFTYKASDGTLSSNAATVSLTVTAVNDAPVRTAGACANLSVLKSSGTTSLGLAGLAYGPGGGSDESSQSLAYRVTTVPAATLGSIVLADGTTVVTANTSYTLAQIQGMKFKTASGGATGSGTFAFTVTDNGTTNGAAAPLSLTQPLTISVTASPAISSVSLWSPSTTPTVGASGNTNATELGLKFTSDVGGYIAGVRFYKGSTNTGTHTGTLWSSTGTRLATATFTGETASGWQQVSFSTPVAIAANATYVVSYHTNVGHYSQNNGYFATTGYSNGPLHALSGANGVMTYGTGGFPTRSYSSPNYWVDVVFTPSATNGATATSMLAAQRELSPAGVSTSSDASATPLTVDTAAKVAPATSSSAVATTASQTAAEATATAAVKAPSNLRAATRHSPPASNRTARSADSALADHSWLKTSLRGLRFP